MTAVTNENGEKQRNVYNQQENTYVTKDSCVMWPWNMAYKIRLAVLSGLMCVLNVSKVRRPSHYIGICAFINGHKMALSKTDIKACLFIIWLQKQSLSLQNEGFYLLTLS